MPDSLHEIQMAAEPDRVYRAWTTADGLAAWWTRTARKTDSEYVLVFDGGKVEFHFRADEESGATRIRWTGVAAERMPAEWVGTRIVVDLEPAGGGTRMLFGHENWRSLDGAYRICNTTWGELIYRLRDHCEGSGRGPLFVG